MTQASFLGAVVGAGASGAQVRQDFNTCDEALATEQEGSSAPTTTYPFMRWRNDTGKLVKRRNAANSGWEIVENYGATTDPTTGDDAADGYVHGSVWLNVSAHHVFFCADPTTGAAVWVQAGSGQRRFQRLRPHRRGRSDQRRLHRRPDHRRRRQGDDDHGRAHGGVDITFSPKVIVAHRHQSKRRQRQHPRRHRRHPGIGRARRNPDVGRLHDRPRRRQDRHRPRQLPLPQAHRPRLLPLVQGRGGDDHRPRPAATIRATAPPTGCSTATPTTAPAGC